MRLNDILDEYVGACKDILLRFIEWKICPFVLPPLCNAVEYDDILGKYVQSWLKMVQNMDPLIFQLMHKMTWIYLHATRKQYKFQVARFGTIFCNYPMANQILLQNSVCSIKPETWKCRLFAKRFCQHVSLTPPL